MRKKIVFLLSLFIFCKYLFSQEPKLILPIGHTLGVSSAVFSPDGKRMVTSALDNTAKIWDVESGRLLANLRGHTDTLYSATFSPDGKKIVTTSEDGTAKIWDANSTLLLKDLTGHVGKVFYVEFSPDGKKIVTTSENATAKIWDAASGKHMSDLVGHTIALNNVRFSPDGKKIVTSADDYTAKIWDAESGKLLVNLKGHNLEVWLAEFNPDGKKIITVSNDSTIKIWDAVTGIILKDLRHNAPVKIGHFSPDGKKFISASDDGDVKLWNAETGSIIANIKGKDVFKIRKGGYYPDNVSAADFSPDGKKIVTAYNFDSSVRIWDAFTGILLRHIKRNLEYVNAVSFSRDGKKFSLALAYGHIEIYDWEKGNLLTDLKGAANYIQGFQYSPDGKRILVSNWYGSAKLLDASTGTLVAAFKDRNNFSPGVRARFSPDGKKIAVQYLDTFAEIRDATTGILLFELTGHKRNLLHVLFSSDGKKILTASLDSTLRIWDVAKGDMIMELKGRAAALNFFSLKGNKIVTTSGDSIATVMDVESGKILQLKNQSSRIQRVLFSPDGKKVLTHLRNNNLTVWDAETGVILYIINEPGKKINLSYFAIEADEIVLSMEDIKTQKTALKIIDAFTGKKKIEFNIQSSGHVFHLITPDKKNIITRTEDGSIANWDIGTGSLIYEIKNDATGRFGRIALSPDGKKLYSCPEDGVIRIRDLQTGNLLGKLDEHTFAIDGFHFSPDGKKIITISHDYTVKVWDAESGTSLYTFVSVGKDDFLITDQHNHFDGTEAARKLLYFTCGTEVIELDQLKDQLWVPNLAERVLNGETIAAAKLSDLHICNLTPVVDTIEQSALQYRFRIIPRMGGLGATIIYVNGIEVKRYGAAQLQQQKNEYVLAIDKKELQKLFIPKKENIIMVKSLTARNSISSRAVSFNEKGNEKNDVLPNLYAVVVGVSDYKGDELDLRFAAKDAVDMANAIEISAKKLLNTDGKEHVFIYKMHTGPGRDKFPEKNGIREIFTEVGKKASPNDILMIFFAGHGVVESEKNQFYFLTADASGATVAGALKNVGISTEELAEWIKPQVMKAQKRILIFDACNSGQAIKEIISFNKNGKDLLAARGDDKGKQIKAIEKLNEKSGMFILAASASDQKAYEIGKYNQGALTYSLLKAIKEQPDILEDRQFLNISRWFNAAEKSVNELSRETGARQQPQLVSTTNFNIGVVDDDVRNKIVLPFEKPLVTRSDFRNNDLRIDNLKLRNLVDKELDNLSGNENNASILFSPEYDGVSVYAISGDYKVTGNNVSVSIILTRGGTEIKTRFEITGDSDKTEKIANSIALQVLEWLKNNH